MSTQRSVNTSMLYLFTLMLHFPLFFFLYTEQCAIVTQKKCITRVMGMCKCWEKHNHTIAHVYLWQPPHPASHTVLSPFLFLHCLDHSIILSLLILPMLSHCVYTLSFSLSLSLHDLSALFMLSSSYALISMDAFFSITLPNFSSSNCTPVPHYCPTTTHVPFLFCSSWNVLLLLFSFLPFLVTLFLSLPK